MSLRKHQRGNGTPVTFRRVQKRNKRRLLEAPPHKWKEWDAAARALELNWSEFARRALNTASGDFDFLTLQRRIVEARTLSEKPAAKNGAVKRVKAARPGRAGKGSSRS
jgi:hypothetical protein